MKKRIFSGIQPSGALTIGNYLGALKNWTKLVDEYECIFSVVDLHAITVRQDPKELKERCYALLAQYIACGLEPEKCTMFVQSHVPEHSQLAWILNCYTYMGELQRMTQFKDKSSKHADNINAGLFTYPVLMAADILIYDADYVPVGKDQKQHLELARDIAHRFNKKYGETFKIPEPLLVKNGSKVMSLTDPTKKMSKSDPNEKSCIYLTDPENVIRKKIGSAVTDSETCVKYDVENKPGISNLLTILSACTNKSISELEIEFKDANYGTFKKAVADAVVELLKPIQEKFTEYVNSNELDEILNKGRDNASYAASKMIRKVYKKIGLGRNK